jgi:hypothetical protein
MVGARFSEKELDEAMAQLDPSGDGQVDFSEFKAYWVRPLRLAPSALRTAVRACTGLKPDVRACAQDENFVKGGGLLKGIISTFDQLEQVVDERTGNSVAYHPDRYIDSDDSFRAQIKALFAMIDRDHDLTLDAEEFAKFLTKKGVDVPANLEEQFVKYDTNGNGTIDDDELAGVVKGLGLLDIVPSPEEAALYMVRFLGLSHCSQCSHACWRCALSRSCCDVRSVQDQAASNAQEKAGEPGSVRTPSVE